MQEMADTEIGAERGGETMKLVVSLTLHSCEKSCHTSFISQKSLVTTTSALIYWLVKQKVKHGINA